MATVSQTRICNLALSNIGHKSFIEDLSTSNNEETRQCNLWYDFSREMTLEAFDWSFARKRQQLAVHGDAVPTTGEWAYRYQYPVDCLSMRSIVNPLGPDADAIPFMREIDSTGVTSSILTDQFQASAIYTFDQKNTTAFTSHFVNAFSYALAVQLAMPLTRSLKVKEAMEQKFNLLILEAPRHNANEEVARKPREAEVIRART